MASVWNGKTLKCRKVKNLGWLLRHAGLVERITVAASATPDEEGHLLMVAWLNDGRRFSCHWASEIVCEQWLKRPSLQHASVSWTPRRLASSGG